MHATDPPQFLITDGNRRPALAVIRSLGRRGISSLVISEVPKALTFSSRYARHTAVSPSPAREPDAWFEFLLDTAQQYQIPMVLKPPGPAGNRLLPSFSFKVLYANNESQLASYLQD